MKDRVGRVQRQVRRGFIAANGEPVATQTLLVRSYPTVSKFKHWHWWNVARAAHRFGVNVRRGWWVPNEELRRLIRR